MGPSATRRVRHGICVLALALALGAPSAARAGDGVAAEGGIGLGSAVCTLVYAPLKIAYAAGGVTLSVLAYLWTWGDTDVSGPIYTVAIAGDYVVTPDHLKGNEDLVFAGDYR